MLVGYARTSTLDQIAGLEAQIRVLQQHSCEKIFQEQVSSIGARRELERAIDFCREGDVLIVTKLDRLARSVTHLGAVLGRLEMKRVGLRILNLNLDSTSATGKLMLNLMVSIAQFEREMMLERQREGIAKAKAEGKYKGRQPTAQAKSADVASLAAAGLPRAEIAKRLGIGRASVYRILSREP
jgi:DNA invertase Pin-like site-specific DNA recombinase